MAGLCRQHTLMPQQLDRQNNQASQEQQDGDAVDPMHVFYPLGFWCVGIFLFQVEVLCYLIENAH